MNQLRCSNMTIDDWKRVIYFMNPNMELLNEEPPTNKENLIVHCGICESTFSRTTQVVKDSYYKKMQTNSSAKWCPYCSNKAVKQGVNDLATLRPDLVQYFKSVDDAKDVVLQSGKTVELECPDCHTIKRIKVQTLVCDGFHCLYCNSIASYPNKFCRALLTALPVEEYEFEYIRDWTQGRRYDGYFKYENKKYLLEFDGLQHYTDSHWGAKEKQSENDELKNNLAKINGFKLIRIDCKDTSFVYMKDQIYKSELSELFELDSIDWDKLFQKASVGVIKEIADFYNTHHLTNSDIAKQLHYSRTTVKTCLKKASEIGLIDYKSNRYKKDYDFKCRICEFFINHQDYSNAKLAKMFHTSTARIYWYIRSGLEDGIIDISQFTEDAFKANRFSDLRGNNKYSNIQKEREVC